MLINGTTATVKVAHVRLCHSRMLLFVRAYPRETQASLLVPIANVLTAMSGSWHVVFVIAALMNAAAAIMALAVLKPLRMAHYRVLREAGLDRP